MPIGIPGYRSRFGGLWTDRLDAADVLREKRASGALDAAQAALFEQWIRDGYVMLPGAVSAPLVDAFNRDIERAWSGGNARIYADYFEGGDRFTIPVEPRHRDMHVKVVDLYAPLASARRVALAAPVVAFLRLLFERDPMAFQSLYFRLGSMQPMHQDTAYVQVGAPLEFVGCWVALEDVQAGSGELEYYVGSHRIQEFLWDGQHKWMPADHPDHELYLAFLHEQARRRGLARVQFRPQRGDVLLWHADLVHGGSQRLLPGSTRRSLVTHFCPVDRDPGYFAEMPHSEKLRDASGAWFCYAQRWPGALGEPATDRPPRGSRLRSLWRQLAPRTAR